MLDALVLEARAEGEENLWILMSTASCEPRTRMALGRREVPPEVCFIYLFILRFLSEDPEVKDSA